MRRYTQLTLEDREDIMIMRLGGKSITEVASAVGRDKSTVSRELRRNSPGGASGGRGYRACMAKSRYEERRRNCGRGHALADPDVFGLVARCFLEDQLSPEQIEGRLILERGNSPVSDGTIYREIHAGLFDRLLPRGCKAERRLRHRGKRRRPKGAKDARGQIRIPHDISERPVAADERSRLGDWESDTALGRKGGARLVTNVDGKSRYLVGGKAGGKTASEVMRVMMASLSGLPLHSVTPDRGKEFAAHRDVTRSLGVEFYFEFPRHPRERGTNDNTNGLLREYFPKGSRLTASARRGSRRSMIS